MNRYWFAIAARPLVGVIIVAWAASYLGTGSGEREFQKTLNALKQVHTFRATVISSPANNLH